ncbi:nitroreductase family protein [Jhaorihella thermophila]|uniref:Putative NAD(P)H nitroreductase n=1 Tax=Jhaorihella thermophila TaxID=488547 RepID=A0A1H5T4R5_9RHOB|nr:nitroreductase [Jhaorihella thermophila]SEF57800.1 Nitroreductase [Jhaorihella thermophila]
MPDRNQAALDFLLTRRSRPAKTLTAPGPSRAELEPILTAALRSPDHGKLEPWRLIVIEKPAMPRLADLAEERGRSLGKDERDIEKGRGQFDQGVLIVAVIESPVDSDKVPAIEQTYSAGAVCLALLNTALASGWGANWLTGWMAHDPEFCEKGLGLAPHERVAGFIHIGTETVAPPERPRPDLAAKTSWLDQ